MVVGQSEMFLTNTTPSARLRLLRGFFLLAQPPLLARRGDGFIVSAIVIEFAEIAEGKIRCHDRFFWCCSC